MRCVMLADPIRDVPYHLQKTDSPHDLAHAPTPLQLPRPNASPVGSQKALLPCRACHQPDTHQHDSPLLALPNDILLLILELLDRQPWSSSAVPAASSSPPSLHSIPATSPASCKGRYPGRSAGPGRWGQSSGESWGGLLPGTVCYRAGRASGGEAAVAAAVLAAVVIAVLALGACLGSQRHGGIFLVRAAGVCTRHGKFFIVLIRAEGGWARVLVHAQQGLSR
ncbi:hypothetical protein VTG60DRAFT_2672 [Thermothelomyces hinnuleus]